MNELYHHGIKGQKWGVRRYQNEDGSLTNAGRSHYGYESPLTKLKKKSASNNKDKYATAIGTIGGAALLTANKTTSYKLAAQLMPPELTMAAIATDVALNVGKAYIGTKIGLWAAHKLDNKK